MWGCHLWARNFSMTFDQRRNQSDYELVETTAILSGVSLPTAHLAVRNFSPEPIVVGQTAETGAATLAQLGKFSLASRAPRN